MLKNFCFLRRNWIYLPSNYFSSYYVYQVYVFVYTKLCKKLNWKNSICIRVNNFAKSVNFTGVFTKKAIEIIKAGTLLSCRNVYFIVIYTTRITIYSF